MAIEHRLLIELINKAKGERSLTHFAQHCGIDAGHMSRILRGIMQNPPTPETLKKIADKAYNGVKYEDLMVAAGHLKKVFAGSNLVLLRKDRSYEEYSNYLKSKGGVYLSPILLERYEKEIEQPDEVVIDYICTIENLGREFFFQSHNSDSLAVHMNNRKDQKSASIQFMEKEVEQWVRDPRNYPYIEFIYKACKSGISVDLLDKAEITIKIK